MHTTKDANRRFANRLRRLNRRRDPVSKRRRNTLIGDEEREDILTLHKAGYTFARIANTLDRTEATVARVVHASQAALREQFEAPLLASYARAAEVAAEDGDHRPALDMLDRLGSIPETSRQRTALSVAFMTSEAQRAMVTNGAKAQLAPHGPIVNIGIGLPGQLQQGVSQILSHSVTIEDASQKQGLIVAGRSEASTDPT
jgi:hypothetical protein